MPDSSFQQTKADVKLIFRWLKPVKKIFDPEPGRVDWLASIPFFLMHLMCLGVLWVGFSWVALAVASFFYFLRIFAITGFYHRYFSHKTFKTSRFCQFLMGVLGSSAVQRGPLWWAAHHRHHHLYSDDEKDIHSPLRSGFLWSHMGWFMTPRAAVTNYRMVPDLAKFPELCFLDRHIWVVPFVLATAIFSLGYFLGIYLPELGTNGLQMLIWGFFVSTVFNYHATYTINSLSHKYGTRPYPTKDTSVNNFLLALLTFGEGWHNNHHYYQSSTRQGFRWYQVDLTYYILVVMSWLGLVWNLNPVPQRVLDLPGQLKKGQVMQPVVNNS